MLLVLDASVILKWVITSEGDGEEDAALGILRQWLDGVADILLPPLWIYEVANVLGRRKPKEAAELLDILAGYSFNEADIRGATLVRALVMMRELGVAFYDAIYHAVALERGGLFVTADKRYQAKAARLGSIVLLADVPSTGSA